MGSSTVSVDTLNDDRLGGYSGSATPAFEYNAGTSRPRLQSTLYGGNLTTSDWVQNTNITGGNTYQYQCQAQVTFGPSDPNGTLGGVPLQRYAWMTSPALPATVTGKSGIIFDELIDASPQTLTTSNQIVVKFILRI